MADAGSRGRWLAPGLGPLIGLRVSVSSNPWRIGPAWAVAAGALAAGLPLDTGATLLRLLGGVLLADSAWGAVWAVMAGAAGEPRSAERWGLPYIQPAAPIMQVSDRVRGLASGAGCHDLLVSAGLALGLAALLGLVPLLLSVAVLASALVAQLVAERGGRPAFAYALLSAGLPWALGLSLTGRSLHELTQPLILGLAFVVLVWGAERLRGNGQASTFGAWAGQVAVLGALAGLRLPWAACVAVLLFMPPSWWLLHARAEQATGDHAGAMVLALERGAIWWWLAFLLAAVSLRQITMS